MKRCLALQVPQQQQQQQILASRSGVWTSFTNKTIFFCARKFASQSFNATSSAPKMKKSGNDLIEYSPRKRMAPRKKTATSSNNTKEKKEKTNAVTTTQQQVRKLTPQEIQQAGEQLADNRIQRELVPFKDPAKIQALKKGLIIPPSLSENLVVQEQSDGNIDIFNLKDPHWLKVTAALMQPFETAKDVKVEYLKQIETNMNAFFARRRKNVYNFNLLLRAMAIQRKKQDSFDALKAMKEHGIQPDSYTYVAVINACALDADFENAIHYMMDMSSRGLKLNQHVYGAVVHALVRGKQMSRALNMVETMRAHNLEPDAVTHSTIITGFILTGDLTRAWDYFEVVQSRHNVELDQVSYTIMINAAAEAGEAEKALFMFENMETLSIAPSEITYNTLIKACAKRKETRPKCFELAEKMQAQGHMPDIYTYNTLIHVCAAEGKLDKAVELLEKMKTDKVQPDDYTYNIMINAYATNSYTNTSRSAQNIANSLALFDQMQKQGSAISIITLNSLLETYCAALKVQAANNFLNTEFAKYSITPDPVTYNIMIHMYCKRRLLDDAVKTLQHVVDSKMKPTYMSYRAIAFAYCRHGMHQEAKKWLERMHTEGGYMLNPADVLKFRCTVMGTRNKVKELNEDVEAWAQNDTKKM